MNEKPIEQIRRWTEEESTEKLLKTWADDDINEWSDEVFVAVHGILVAGGENSTPDHECPVFVGDGDDISLWERIPLLLLSLMSLFASYWLIRLMVIPLSVAGLLAGCASIYALWATGGFRNWRHRTDNEVFTTVLVSLQIPWICFTGFFYWISLVIHGD